MKTYFLLGLYVIASAFMQPLSAQTLDVSQLLNQSIDAYENSALDTAVYNLELAAMLKPFDKDISSNLKIAKSKVAVDIVEIPGFFLSRWLNNAAGIFLPGIWKYLAILLMIMIAVLMHRKLVKRADDKLASWGLIGALATLLVISAVLGKVRYDQLHNGQYGIVMGNDVQALKQGPDKVSKDVKDISPGVKLEILDQSGTWYKVSAMDKEQGWIPQEGVRKLKV